MDLLYEASGKFNISVPFIVLCLIDFLLIIFCLTGLRKFLIGELRAFTMGEKIFFGFIIFVLTAMIISIVSSAIGSMRVYSRYKNGDVQIVEGEIYNYCANWDENNLGDSFYVDDVRFEVPCFTTPWGYPLRQQDGGELDNGTYVKIYFVSYKYDNVIMKIEIKNN